MDVKPPKTTMPTDVNKILPESKGDEGATGIPPVVPPVTTPPATQPGEKTDPALLLKSLQDEREKRRLAEDAQKAAEAELKRLQGIVASGDMSEGEKALKTQIDTLESTIAGMNAAKVKADLETKFPALKDKAAEFAEFRKAYPAGNDESIAKIFLAENGLLDTGTRRGLEKPSGGGRTVQPQGMTYAEAEELRKNNFRLYTKLLREGKLNDLQ